VEALGKGQGFFDIELPQSSNTTVTLRAGRQEMSLGSGYLVSTRDGRNIRRSFDGVRLTALTGDWTIDTFALRPLVDNPGFFDDPADHASNFWGVYAVRPFRILPGGKIDLYYMGLGDKKVSFDGRGAGREQRETIGTRLWGTYGRWDYNHDLTFQWGSFQAHAIRAWAATVETGYRFESTFSKPRVGIRANTFSGNRDPRGRALGTFNSLYQTGPYFNYAELLGNRNLMVVQPSVEFNLSPRVFLKPNFAAYWRESTRDGLYSASGGSVDSGQGSRARYIGAHAAIQGQWKLNRHATLFVEYLHFFPGGFLRQSTAGRNINYLTEWLDLRF